MQLTLELASPPPREESGGDVGVPEHVVATWSATKHRHPDAVVLVQRDGQLISLASDAATIANVTGAEHGAEMNGKEVVSFPLAELDDHLLKLVAAGLRVAIQNDSAIAAGPSRAAVPRRAKRGTRAAMVAAALAFPIEGAEVLRSRGATEAQLTRILRAAASEGRTGEGWRLSMHRNRPLLELGARDRVRRRKLLDAFRRAQGFPGFGEVPLPDLPDIGSCEDPIRLPISRWGYRVESQWRTSSTSGDRAGENGFRVVGNPKTILRLDAWARETYPYLYSGSDKRRGPSAREPAERRDPTMCAPALALPHRGEPMVQDVAEIDARLPDEKEVPLEVDGDSEEYPASWHQLVQGEVAEFKRAAALLRSDLPRRKPGPRKVAGEAELDRINLVLSGDAAEYAEKFGDGACAEIFAAADRMATAASVTAPAGALDLFAPLPGP